MSDVLAAAVRTDPALAAVVAFTRRHGPEAAALAMHAALPLGLSPELVHLLRVNFVRHAPFIAEADLLLSPLCTEVGGGMYEMDEDVRELLLGELAASAAYGPAHVRRVARFLRVWAARALDETADADAQEHLRVQQWVALAYEEPARAAEELAGALRAGVEAADRPEVARVARLTTVLSAPLAAQVELRRYAGAVERVAASGRVAVPTTTGDVPIGRERLPALDRVIRLWQPQTAPSSSGAEQQSTVADEPPIQQQANVAEEPPIQQQANVANEAPVAQQADVAAEPPIEQQASVETAPGGYRVARVVVVGDTGVGKTTLITRITGRDVPSRGGSEPYSTRWVVPAAESGGGERDVVFVEPESDHMLPLELADAAAVIVVVKGTDASASEQRWKSRLGQSRPVLVFEVTIPEEGSGSTSGMMRFGDEYVVPFLDQDLEELRTELLHEAIDWRAQPAAPARVAVDELEHYLANRLQTALVVGLEQVLQNLLMRSGGMSSEQAEVDLQGALLCVSARGTVRLVGEKQQQLVSGLTYARGVERIWRVVAERQSAPPHLPDVKKRYLENRLIEQAFDMSPKGHTRELLPLSELLVDDLVRAGWAYRVELGEEETLVIPSLFQVRTYLREQRPPDERALMRVRWTGRVHDLFVLLLVHLSQRGRLNINSPRSAQLTLVHGHVFVDAVEEGNSSEITLSAGGGVQEPKEWEQLFRDVVSRYLPPGGSPTFSNPDGVPTPHDPLQPPEGVDLAQACLVVLPHGTTQVGERVVDFDALWEHLFKPAVADTWLPEGSSLVPVRISELPPPGTPLPDWTRAARLVALDVTGLDAPEIRTAVSRFRPNSVVPFADSADLPDEIAVYLYVSGTPEELARQRSFVSFRLAAALGAQGAQTDEEGEPASETVRLELIEAPANRIGGQTQTVSFAIVASSERSHPGPNEYLERVGAFPDRVLATLLLARGATAQISLRAPWNREADHATLEWHGHWHDTALITAVPADFPAGEVKLSFTIAARNPRSPDVQIHNLEYPYLVDEPVDEPAPIATKPRTAYACCAVADREKVLGHVAVMKAVQKLEIAVYEEVVRAGEDWQVQFPAEIASRDVFMLFWSEAAARSEAIRQEWTRAVDLYQTVGKPGIQIHLLEQPASTLLPEPLRQFPLIRVPDRPIVAISGTVRDLSAHRAHVMDACYRMNMVPRLLEVLPASPADFLQASLDIVDGADVYIGVFAHRYGYIPGGSEISISQMEYERAVERGIPRLIFLLHDDVPVAVGEIDFEHKPKLDRFKERLKQEQVVAVFRNPEDLHALVLRSLYEVRTRLEVA